MSGILGEAVKEEIRAVVDEELTTKFETIKEGIKEITQRIEETEERMDSITATIVKKHLVAIATFILDTCQTTNNEKDKNAKITLPENVL